MITPSIQDIKNPGSDIQRQKILIDTANFLAAGGAVRKIPNGMSSENADITEYGRNALEYRDIKPKKTETIWQKKTDTPNGWEA